MDKLVVMDGGEAILQACRDMDMDYIVSSPGSDWGSVWEALGRQQLNGVKGPKYLSCGHETLAALFRWHFLAIGRWRHGNRRRT